MKSLVLHYPQLHPLTCPRELISVVDQTLSRFILFYRRPVKHTVTPQAKRKGQFECDNLACDWHYGRLSHCVITSLLLRLSPCVWSELLPGDWGGKFLCWVRKYNNFNNILSDKSHPVEECVCLCAFICECTLCTNTSLHACVCRNTLVCILSQCTVFYLKETKMIWKEK